MPAFPVARRLAAVALVAAPLAFTSADVLRRVLEPADPEPVPLAQAVAVHPGAWLTAGLLSSLACLLVPAVTAVGLLVHGRGARLARTGCALTAVGAAASLVHAAGFFGLYGALARAGADSGVVRELNAAADGYPFFVAFIVLFTAGMVLGPVLLSIGLRRARAVPLWVPFATAVFVLSGLVGGVVAGVVGLAAAAVAFTAMARFLVAPGDPAPARARVPEGQPAASTGG
jgi:hypothetical protein